MRGTPSTPAVDDVVVRQDQRNGEVVYILDASPNQLLHGTCQEAVALALMLARGAGVAAWFIGHQVEDVVRLNTLPPHKRRGAPKPQDNAWRDAVPASSAKA